MNCVRKQSNKPNINLIFQNAAILCHVLDDQFCLRLQFVPHRKHNASYVLRSTVSLASALLWETARDSLCLPAELWRHTLTSSSARSTGTSFPRPEAASVGRRWTSATRGLAYPVLSSSWSRSCCEETPCNENRGGVSTNCTFEDWELETCGTRGGDQ